MNLWIIVGIIAGLLIFGGIAVVNAISVNAEQETSETTECSSCGNSCSLESNCGLATCGAVSGGNCGCGR